MKRQADLQAALAVYDGRATTLLSELQQRLVGRPGFHGDLFACLAIPDPHIADGASWILRAEAEAGRIPAPALIRTLAEMLPLLASWQAQLHLCQCVANFDFGADQAEVVMEWADTLGDHKRPFLRAWSLHVIVTLAREVPGWAERVNAALQKAQADPAPSVRARARALRNS